MTKIDKKTESKIKRHMEMSLDIEGLGLEGIVGQVIYEGVHNILSTYKLTQKDIKRYKQNQSSYYDETGKDSNPSVVVETYIVDCLSEELWDKCYEDNFNKLMVDGMDEMEVNKACVALADKDRG
tara:strand:- start:305 stop:679 length:375 start_codon:yes stop_codon:yes gene_type:complete